MTTKKITGKAEKAGLGLKLREYVKLLKFRLSFLVALSASFGYAMAAGNQMEWLSLLLMGIGGLMTTGAANIFNQIFEKELDGKMKRTAQRPLPTGSLSIAEALVFAIILLVGGVILLGQIFNLTTALLAIIGFQSYAFVYTPLKRITPFSVFIGAIPGALPPLIGWVGFTDAITIGGIILFAFQFFWQFPHFWAIAWVLDEDYQRAGFKMMPTTEGKGAAAARLMLIYTLMLVPLCLMPVQVGVISWTGAGLLALLGLGFSYPAFLLKRKLDNKFAKRLLFASFIYLPLMQVVFLIFGKMS